jgi:hypothetical protein
MDFVEPFGFWICLFLFNGFYFIEPNGFKKIDIHSDPIGKDRMKNRNKMRMNRERDGMSEKNLLTPTGASAQVGGGDEGPTSAQVGGGDEGPTSAQVGGGDEGLTSAQTISRERQNEKQKQNENE